MARLQTSLNRMPDTGRKPGKCVHCKKEEYIGIGGGCVGCGKRRIPKKVRTDGE